MIYNSKILKSNDMFLGTGVSFTSIEKDAESVIEAALVSGVRHFDTAPSYNTESLLGKLLYKICNDKGIHREEIFIQTKIDAIQMQDCLDKKIKYFVEDALNKLKTDYLDSVLIHWPIPEYLDRTWHQLESLKQSNLVKNIGICNVRMRQLIMLLDYRPDIIQIERHPLNTFFDEVNFCIENAICVQAYSPLCKMDNRIKNNMTIKKIGEKYHKSISQIVLRWHLDTGVIPVFTTSKPERIFEHISIDDFSLDKDEIEEINAINQDYKIYLESISCPGF